MIDVKIQRAVNHARAQALASDPTPEIFAPNKLLTLELVEIDSRSSHASSG